MYKFSEPHAFVRDLYDSRGSTMYAMRFFAPWLIAIGCTTAAQPPPEAPKPAAPPAQTAEPSEPPGIPANYIEMKPDRVVAQMDALLLVDEASNSVMPVDIGGTE